MPTARRARSKAGNRGRCRAAPGTGGVERTWIPPADEGTNAVTTARTEPARVDRRSAAPASTRTSPERSDDDGPEPHRRQAEGPPVAYSGRPRSPGRADATSWSRPGNGIHGDVERRRPAGTAPSSGTTPAPGTTPANAPDTRLEHDVKKETAPAAVRRTDSRGVQRTLEERQENADARRTTGRRRTRGQARGQQPRHSQNGLRTGGAERRKRQGLHEPGRGAPGRNHQAVRRPPGRRRDEGQGQDHQAVPAPSE